MSRKDLIFLVFAAFILSILQISFAGALSPSYCCERTNTGAWCQNVDDSGKCDTSGGLRSVPTSCDATSYCKPGTCVNTQDGVCMENTPQRTCENPIGGKTAGKWYDETSDSVPQCQLGCCLIGDQAAFTTQTRCKQLSSLYGLETNYRTDIRNEAQCIASANPDVKGACVFETDSEKNCKFGARSECQALEKSSGNSNVTFYSGFLCSAEELGTNCGPSKQTIVLDGRDEVFFTDTCGNPANIYDADRANDKAYWDKTVSKADSCGAGDSNSGSDDCGNCNYLLGSVGKSYDRGVDSKAPQFGNYICRGLDCKFDSDSDGSDETFKHGETWCAQSEGTGSINVQNGQITSAKINDEKENVPGSRYYRKVCYNGEVTTEPCADFRQEVCLQSSIETKSGTDFKTAACRVNKWQDCAAQKTTADCEDSTLRDCKVVKGINANGQPGLANDDGQVVDAACAPKYPPGFDFWNADGDAGQLCSQASATCTVKLKRNLIEQSQGKWICDSGCECIGEKKGSTFSDADLKNYQSDWAKLRNNLCISLGDCGVKVNFVDQRGRLVINDLHSYSE